MDDIILEKKQTDTEIKITDINELHPSLTPAMERVQKSGISFLYMYISQKDNLFSHLHGTINLRAPVYS